MLRRIKYLLLQWLLNDICDKTNGCMNCKLCGQIELCGETYPICDDESLLRQARRVWKLEKGD